MTTPMTREEIIRDYRQAANKQYQIGVLADMNLCSKAEIVAILREAGEKVSGHYKDVAAPRTAEQPQEKTDIPEQPQQEKTDTPAPEAEPAEDLPAEEAESELLTTGEKLALIVRSAAVQVIGQLIKKADAAAACAVQDDRWWIETNFREQCRGVLALVAEIEDRCTDMEEETAE